MENMGYAKQFRNLGSKCVAPKDFKVAGLKDNPSYFLVFHIYGLL